MPPAADSTAGLVNAMPLALGTYASIGDSVPPPHPVDRVESHSIDFIPLNERQGRVVDHGKFWFLSNFQFYSIALGFIGPSMNLGFGATITAAALGILLGTLFTAFHASQGPHLGLPQMIQSRAQFGYRGVIIPLFGALFTFVGFNVVDTILISQGLHGFFGWDSRAIALVLAGGAATIAIYGYKQLHRVFRVLFWISLPFYMVLSVGMAGGAIASHRPAVAAFSAVAFAAQFTASFAYNITYAPCVSDYTRYLPRNASPSGLVLSVYWGASLSAIWLIVVGAWMGTYLGVTDSLVGLGVAGNAMFWHFGTVLVLVSATALAATMGLNTYSAMLSLITGIDSCIKLPRSQRLRIIGISVVTAMSLGVSLALSSNALTALYASLSLTLYLLVPWTAVNLMDYFCVRKGRYAITALFTPRGIYGAWGWRGIAAYTAGFLASVPFFVLNGFYQGPAAKALSGVDVSWFPGLVVSAVTYYLLSRSLVVKHDSLLTNANA
jgi:nucleobase:cation symporter-1, NCS1 family